MADKIPIYGELDCRTEENIIADATQIRYDATKTVKEKIADLETGGTGGVDEITFNNATYDLLQAVCGIADDEVTDVIKLQIDATKKQTLFVSSLTNDAQCAFGLANDNGTILKPTSNFIGNFPMALKCPFVITSYQSAYSSKWIVRYFDSNINGYTTERVEIVSSTATKLPITLGISVTSAGGNVYNWTKDIANKLSYKIVTSKYSDARPIDDVDVVRKTELNGYVPIPDPAPTIWSILVYSPIAKTYTTYPIEVGVRQLTVPYRDTKGNFKVGNLTADDDGQYCANKKFVEDAIAKVNPQTFKTLFGNQNVAGTGNIDLYEHDIQITGTNIDVICTIYSSKNVKIDSLTDLKTVAGDTFIKPCTGVVNGKVAYALTQTSIKLTDGTTQLLTGVTFADNMTTI